MLRNHGGVELKPLGHGVYYSEMVNAEGEYIGILVWHDDCPIHGGRSYLYDCVGSVLYDTPYNAEHDASRPKWQLVRKDPLTLTPSILRKECQLHGYITDGKWVPA